ncbi:MAG: hypothetical protein IJU79_00830 [Desulfovibrionaceae bacterium]|nr:hypothetical protein [Desulfovibrionaceae bacterium]
MKSKIINFADGRNELKDQQKKQDSTKTEEVEELDGASQKENADSKGSIIHYPKKTSDEAKFNRIQAILKELLKMHKDMLRKSGVSIDAFADQMLRGDYEANPEEIEKVTGLVEELGDITGYSLSELILGGKFEELVKNAEVLQEYEDIALKYRHDAAMAAARRQNMLPSNINLPRRRIKYIIKEIYESYEDHALLLKLQKRPQAFQKLKASEKEFVEHYYALVEELEVLSSHSAEDVFLSANLRRLAKRYKVKFDN